MTKRLTRYNTAEAINNNLPSLVGEKINIVATDGRVFYGILDKFENNLLHFRNLRMKKQQIPLDEIAEIIYDY